jgi:hypothetical protein
MTPFCLQVLRKPYFELDPGSLDRLSYIRLSSFVEREGCRNGLKLSSQKSQQNALKAHFIAVGTKVVRRLLC